MADHPDQPILESCNVIRAKVCHDGFVRAGGVILGRLETAPDGKQVLQVIDRDRRRCDERGDRCVLVDLQSIAELKNETPGE